MSRVADNKYQIVVVDSAGAVTEAVAVAEKLHDILAKHPFLRKYEAWARYSGTGPPSALDK